MASRPNSKIILAGGGISVTRVYDDGVIKYTVRWMSGDNTRVLCSFTTKSMAVVAIMVNRDLVKLPAPLAEWKRLFE